MYKSKLICIVFIAYASSQPFLLRKILFIKWDSKQAGYGWGSFNPALYT